jgi:DNA-binding protein H-NS
MAPKNTLASKNTVNQNLTDQQRLERLAQLCEELQAAVDQAGDHRRLLEQVRQTAQELLTDEESKPQPKRNRGRSPVSENTRAAE